MTRLAAEESAFFAGLAPDCSSLFKGAYVSSTPGEGHRTAWNVALLLWA